MNLSVYKSGHRTETRFIHVQNYIMMSIDRGKPHITYSSGAVWCS